MAFIPNLIPPASAAVLMVGLGSTALGSTLGDVLIEDVPHIRQKPDFCGEACTAMMLETLGTAMDQDAVFQLTGVDPTEGRGAYTAELGRALRRIGFEVGPVWHSVNARNATAELDELWTRIHGDLERGVASIVCMHYDGQPNTTEHFRLILGYDAKADEVIYHEPAEANGAYRRMKKQTFFELWPLKYEKERWTAIRFALQPTALKAPAPVRGKTDADYAQHIRALRSTLPKGFTVVLQKPFVVIGDESPAMVKRRAEGTVAWSVRHLESSYFPAPPKEILNIWLFRNESSYRKHAKAFLGHTPDTPFGYYSPSAKALVMNIATGGGTLVHEIVHPYMEANFPDVPAWFNEGLGSLYEQSAERKGQIVGLTNWRLAGLQDLIRAKRVPSFRALTSTTDHQFYEEDTGDNYAQARYLLYSLQEKGLLRRYYRAFLANRDTDPTGYNTLQKVLGAKDMEAFQRSWEQEVLRLRFP